MKLLRLVDLKLKGTSRDPQAHSWRIDDVAIEMQGPWKRDGEMNFLTVAAHDIDIPDANTEGVLVIPTAPRRATERAIEAVASTLALSERCKVSIFSRLPSMALNPSSAIERAALEALNARMPEPKIDFGYVSDYRIELKFVGQLGDRIDGVTLLAEAVAHDHATGRFHEFVRLFERAFALSYRKIDKKLARFLEGAGLGYSRAEVTQWLVHLRDPATHADRGPQIALESDIRPVIQRMEQAAYDVLLNKKTWADRSVDRRSVWYPPVATTSPSGNFRGVAGTTARLNVAAVDAFGAYRIDLTACGVQLPPEWWVPYRPPSQSVETGVELLQNSSAAVPRQNPIGGAQAASRHS